MAFGYEEFEDLDFVDEKLEELFERGGEGVFFRLEDARPFEHYRNRDDMDLIYDLVNHPEIDEDRASAGRLPAELDIDDRTVVAEPFAVSAYTVDLQSIEEAAYLCENYPVEAIEVTRPLPDN